MRRVLSFAIISWKILCWPALFVCVKSLRSIILRLQCYTRDALLGSCEGPSSEPRMTFTFTPQGKTCAIHACSESQAAWQESVHNAVNALGNGQTTGDWPAWTSSTVHCWSCSNGDIDHHHMISATVSLKLKNRIYIYIKSDHIYPIYLMIYVLFVPLCEHTHFVGTPFRRLERTVGFAADLHRPCDPEGVFVQVFSIADFSTNYCNLRNLYCGSEDCARS